jgi:hypothetical protein
MVAGHVIECGAQATGGNFSGFGALGHDVRPLGFPLAEIAADGSSVITKHDGTGGMVTVDTVTAQLMYEVASPAYLGPDVTARLDSIALAADGQDRVRISGMQGEPPPRRLKVCVNELGGFRNSVELVLVGLDIDAKADWVRDQIEAGLGRRRPASVEWALARTDRADAATEEAASCRLRCVVKDADPDVVGKAFTAAVVELGLASYPGFTLTAPPAPASPYGVYRAAFVDRDAVHHVVVHPDGMTEQIPPGDGGGAGGAGERRGGLVGLGEPSEERARRVSSPPLSGAAGAAADNTRRVPLGTFVHARSGDKGGDANLGLWVAEAADHPERVDWLLAFVTVEQVKRLVPEAEDFDVDVHPLPNLGAVNVVLHGLLGEGVAASSRFDPQAKALGEWVRARHVDVPEELL